MPLLMNVPPDGVVARLLPPVNTNVPELVVRPDKPRNEDVPPSMNTLAAFVCTLAPDFVIEPPPDTFHVPSVSVVAGSCVRPAEKLTVPCCTSVVPVLPNATPLKFVVVPAPVLTNVPALFSVYVPLKFVTKSPSPLTLN